MKKIFLPSILLLFCLVFQGSQLQAQTVTLLGKTEFGRRATSEETEAQEDEVSVSRHSLEVDARANEKFSAEARAAYWEKDYRSLNELDNITRVYGLTPALLLFRKEAHALQFRFRFTRREKRYPEQDALNFNQVSLYPTFLLEKKKNYSISAGVGWNDYHYLTDTGKDQTIYFQETKVKKTLLDERLDLKSSYRVEMNNFEREGKEKIKHEISAGGRYQFYQPWLESLQLSGSFGKRDTKEVEERDEDVDFSFWEYRLKSEHPLRPDILGMFQYLTFENDFRTNRFDSKGWEVRSDLDYLWVETNVGKLQLEFRGKYKTVEYSADPKSSYRRIAAKLGSSYLRKKDWKVALGYEANVYRFDLSSQDKIRHLFLVEGARWLREGKFYVALLLNYRFLDYSQDPDNHSLSSTLSFRYQF